MAREADIQFYQPSLMKQTEEFQRLAQTEDPELSLCWTGAENAFLDQFVDSLTENGCKRWEKILKLTPMATDTLEERRFRIKTRFNEDLPYTYRMLTQMLNALCGEGNYQLTLYHEEYRLMLLLELSVKKIFHEAEEMVKRVIPANLLLEVELRYNQHLTVANLTHGGLKVYTHQMIREENINGDDNNESGSDQTGSD